MHHMVNKFILFFSICLIIHHSLFGQDSKNEYVVNTATADSLFYQKEFRKSINFYQKAFILNGGLGKVKHRYNAATCYALLNIPDSAFLELNKIATRGKFSHYDMIISDTNFTSLHSNEKWAQILEIIKTNRKNKQTVVPDN